LQIYFSSTICRHDDNRDKKDINTVKCNRTGGLEMKCSYKLSGWLSILLLLVLLLPGCFSANLDTGQGQLTLSDFPDYETLAAWVQENAQPFEAGSGMGAWYAAALAVQRQAAADGYLVSAVLIDKPGAEGEYLVWCTAIAGGDLYWWHPEETECNLMFTAEALEP
jgi:hypothetical protein